MSHSSRMSIPITTAKKILAFLLALSFALTIPLPAHAADEGPGPSSGPRRHLATIIFSGLGGAVLGLSTLSFYGRPQDQLGNIGVGFALGIIAGTAYVTYEMVKQPSEFYGLQAPALDPNDHERWARPSDPELVPLSGRTALAARKSSFSVTCFNWSF